MTLPKGLTVVESPKEMLLGTSRAYGIDFSNLGAPTSAGDTVCYDSDGVVQDSLLSGTASQSGSIITLEEFTPDAAGMFRLVHQTAIQGQTVFGVLDVAVFATIPPSANDKAFATGAYSSLAEIGALVPRRTNSTGVFDDTTRPTVQRLVTIVNQLSAEVDSILAQHGFDIPVTNASAKLVIDGFVSREAATMIEGINGAGRFGPSRKTNNAPAQMIMEDIQNFVKMNAVGLQRLGATRTYSATAGIGYLDTDNSGDEVYPMFQREAFGNIDTDWDN